MIQNQEFIQEFIEEAQHHVEQVESLLVKKGTSLGDDEVNKIFRAVHSVKGTAGFFGLTQIVSLAHTMENLYGEVRCGSLKLLDEHLDVLLAANDLLKDMIENVISSEDVDVTPMQQALSKILECDDMKGFRCYEPAQNSFFYEDLKIDSVGVQLIEDALRHGHHLFRIKLKMNDNLLEYNEGPIRFFNKIQAVGMLIDTQLDISEIGGFEDFLNIQSESQQDFAMVLWVTTVLELRLFADAIGIHEDLIEEIQVEEEKKLSDDSSNRLLDKPIKEVQLAQVSESTDSQQFDPLSISKDTTTVEELPGKSQERIQMDESIRVHVSVLNELLNMASELVLGRNQLLRILETHKKGIPGLAPILQNIDFLTSNIQEKIMLTRMQPVGNVFNKFPRIIRDISKSLSKEIDLIIEGADVELDKSIIEGLGDPLTHLIRNAADHGLEMPDIRVTVGKSRTGTIRLRAYHEGGSVNIDISDDGKGMDTERIRSTALEKNLASRSELDSMDHQAVLNLIFKPGFSTAEKLTAVSGRGVGMDVVKTNIERLGGTVAIFTDQGKGTTIRLILPLTLAIIQSLVVETEGHRFAVPQVDVQEIVKIKAGDEQRKIEFIHDSEVLRLRGKLLPIVHLADVLGIPRTFVHPLTGVKGVDRRNAFTSLLQPEEEASDSNRRDRNSEVIRVLIIRQGNRRFGLAVNRVLGSEETLVKALPTFLKDCGCYSGVTIMGDGKTALILDSEGIIRVSDLRFISESERSLEAEHHGEATEEVQNLLLFKCSGSELFAVDLSMVRRVDEVRSLDLEYVGDKLFARYGEGSLRVIRPENYLDVNKSAELPEKMYVIVPKLVSYPIGILVDRIIDNVSMRLKLNTSDIKMSGLVGSVIHDKHLVLVMNLYELFELADPEHYSQQSFHISDKRTLLLVEDTPFFQRMAYSYLTGAGYDVLTATNGREALDILVSAKVDAIVSDIQMPVMDGFELVKRIRENPKISQLPIIAVTSMTGEYNKKIGLDQGFDYYEYKLDRERLLQVVEQAIDKRRRTLS